MKDKDHRLDAPAETHEKDPGSVAASDMSFVMDKDQTKSEAESEVFVDLAKDGLQETHNSQPSQLPEETLENEYPSIYKLVTILVAVMLAVFLVALDMVSPVTIQIAFSFTNFWKTIVATAIPSITDQFHSLDQVGWYGSAFFLTVAAFQATWGKVSCSGSVILDRITDITFNTGL